jgi:hypothetical protein
MCGITKVDILLNIPTFEYSLRGIGNKTLFQMQEERSLGYTLTDFPKYKPLREA